MTPLKIRSIDPLIFTDGRPFAAEPGAQTMTSLSLPNQWQLAGSIRTALGFDDPKPWKEKGPALKEIAVHGPLLECDGSVMFSAPSDMAVMQDEATGDMLLLRSMPVAGASPSSNLPQGIVPLALPEVPAKVDPQPSKSSGPQWLTVEELLAWYGCAPAPKWISASEPRVWRVDPKNDSWNARSNPLEQRAHVQIGFDRLTAEDGKLFVTEGAVLSDVFSQGQANGGSVPSLEQTRFALHARSNQAVEGIFPFGAEKRLAQIEQADGAIWSPPHALSSALKGGTSLVMFLATPALFGAGWKPDVEALNRRLGLKLKLVSAAMRRRQSIAGWDIQRRGPKPALWLAPAGAVFFFNLLDGDPATLADQWLQPVNDDPVYDKDGFGLALWLPSREGDK